MVDMLEQENPDQQSICLAAHRLGAANPSLKDAFAQLALSRAEILQMWEDNRVEAANRGTWMHYKMKVWLNAGCAVLDSVEMNLLLKFARTLNGLTAFRTEWTIYGEEENLAGSIDFVAINGEGQLVLFDWKRSRDLRSKYTGFRRMKSPLQHLDDCSGVQYRLQLYCYKFIIEKYYGLQVVQMCVVCAHPDNGEHVFVD